MNTRHSALEINQNNNRNHQESVWKESKERHNKAEEVLSRVNKNIAGIN